MNERPHASRISLFLGKPCNRSLKDECQGHALRAYICIGGHFMVVEFVF